MITKHSQDLSVFSKILKSKNYSDNTIKAYKDSLNKFLIYIGKPKSHISQKDVQRYMLDIKNKSNSIKNISINSLKLYFKHIKNTNIKAKYVDRPIKEYKLPKPIDVNVIMNCLEKINNIKHKSILSLAFSVGLRVSEVINLKIKNIDSDRMQMHIVQSKGNKDRYVPLTDKMLLLLREYFKAYKPEVYLFNGQNNLKYSASSCNKIIKKYIGVDHHFHQLRHSCFTHLTDNNIDIRTIQKLAGHSSSKTTEIYTRVSTKTLQKLPLAL